MAEGGSGGGGGEGGGRGEGGGERERRGFAVRMSEGVSGEQSGGG